MHSVTLEYAHAHLPELLLEVAAGEEIVIELDARPLGRLVPEKPAELTPCRNTGWPLMGKYQGLGWMAPDFNETPDCFEGYVK
jgi:antitoxin (DNA-binding transcriptional repressor) of toxin-antitoxin stability system